MQTTPKKDDTRYSPLGLALVGWLAIIGFGFLSILIYGIVHPSPGTNGNVLTVTPNNDTPAAIAQTHEAAREKVMNSIRVSSDLLAGAELDLKNGRMTDLDMASIGAMLQVMNSSASDIQTAWKSRDILTPANIQQVKSLEARLSSFQQRALPKLRLSFKKAAGQLLWEHDVTVTVRGTGNTLISFYGYWFAVNANIKAAQEQLDNLVTHLRFKKIQFASFQESPTGTAYAVSAPGDAVVAVYDGEFHKVEHSTPKP